MFILVLIMIIAWLDMYFKTQCIVILESETISHTCHINVDFIFRIKLSSHVLNINKRIYDEWKACVKEENVRIVVQVNELAYARDWMEEWLLEERKLMIISLYWVMYIYVIICI